MMSRAALEVGSGQLTRATVRAALGPAFDPLNPASVWLATAGPTARETVLDRLARAAGLPLAIVPAAYGGRLYDLRSSLLAIVEAARRDVSVMPTLLTTVTALTVAVVAEDDAAVQRIRSAMDRGEIVGFAMSEEASGSDVVAGTARFSAAEPPGEYLLNGRKWLMGGGRRCREAVIVAAHDDRRGPGAFSAALVELPEGTVQPPTPTLGMSRCEFSDLQLDAVPVPQGAFIGSIGRGLELAMRSQQLVRTLSTAASVAAMDTGLRLATMHLDRLRATGRTRLADAPAARALLGAATVERILADVVVGAATRILQAAPESAGLSSAVVKFLAPTLGRRELRRCADLLGAQAVIALGAGGIIERMRADNEVVRYIDTSVAANLSGVELLASTYDRASMHRSPAAVADAAQAAAKAFDLGCPLEPLHLSSLSMRPAPRDPVILGLEHVYRQVFRAVVDTDPVLAGLVEWTWDKARDELLSHAEQRADERGRRAIPRPSTTAQEVCWLWAAGSCVHTWWFNRDRELYGGQPGSTHWLTDCLTYIRKQVDGINTSDAVVCFDHEEQTYDRSVAHLADLLRHDRPVSWESEHTSPTSDGRVLS